jgi:hypothetical protein
MYMNRPGIKAIDLYHWMDERGGSIELDFRPHFDWGRHTLDMEGMPARQALSPVYRMYVQRRCAQSNRPKRMQ